jgi:hypothetical protein
MAADHPGRPIAPPPPAPRTDPDPADDATVVADAEREPDDDTARPAGDADSEPEVEYAAPSSDPDATADSAGEPLVAEDVPEVDVPPAEPVEVVDSDVAAGEVDEAEVEAAAGEVDVVPAEPVEVVDSDLAADEEAKDEAEVEDEAGELDEAEVDVVADEVDVEPVEPVVDVAPDLPADDAEASGVDVEPVEPVGHAGFPPGPLVVAADSYRVRWEAVQAGFVDEPRQSVENADELVAVVVADILGAVDGERDALAGIWQADRQVTTEELRVAFQRYRAVFDRLLSA